MGKKKPFIDKKNSVTFKLVARSQNDPLFVDETAPQYVLVEKKTKEEVLLDNKPHSSLNQKSKLNPAEQKIEQSKFGIYFDDDYDYLQHLVGVDEIPSVALEINSKIYPKQSDIVVEDNPENGDQPSTSEATKPKIMLPSSVFESTVKEKVDLSKRAALPVGPQLDWDPDIVEAMADDFDRADPNNQLDDDFVTQAMDERKGELFEGEEAEEKYNFDFSYKHKKMEPINENDINENYDKFSLGSYDGSGGEDADDDEDYDDFNEDEADFFGPSKFRGSRQRVGFDCITSKTGSSHFTEYSISSSILPRNDNLQTLDEQFEDFFSKVYADDMAMGALEGEEIAGNVDPNKSALMESMIEEYNEFQNGPQNYEPNKEAIEYVRKKFVEKLKLKDVMEKNKALSEESSGEDDQETEEDEYETIEIVDTARKGDRDRFDCESILSTTSNTMYLPTMLKETDRYGLPFTGRKKKATPGHIQIDPKTGMPQGVFGIESRDTITARKLAALESLDTGTVKTTLSRMSELSIRPKDETPEQRAQRKKELKELRACRRAEKKATRLAFKDEKIRMNKQSVNVSRQNKIVVS